MKSYIYEEMKENLPQKRAYIMPNPGSLAFLYCVAFYVNKYPGKADNRKTDETCRNSLAQQTS